MSNDMYIKDKSKEQILADLYGTAEPGSEVHEQQKMAILVRCTQDLEAQIRGLTSAMEEANAGNKRLNGKLLFLNLILTLATVVGAAATLLATLRALRVI